MDEKIDWQEPDSLGIAGITNQTNPQDIGQNIFGQVMGMLPDFSVTPEEIHDAGDVVFVVGTYRGTAASTDKKLETKFVHTWRFGPNGKINGFRTDTDTHAWLEALGKV